jgi:hypothetical protein
VRYCCLIDPKVLSLDKTTAFAKRWVACDPTLDVTLLRIGVLFEPDDAILEGDLVRPWSVSISAMVRTRT